MIRAAIIEDEKKSRETLSGLLKRYCKRVEIVAEADGFKSGLEAIRKYEPEVVFLDIQMPDGSGFKLLEELGEINFEIIFTTAYDQFAIKAIKYSALDYLLKPIVPEELISAVTKVEKKKESGNLNKNVNVLLDNLRNRDTNSGKLALSTAEKIHIVEISNIIRCESDNYYTRFFFNNGQKLLISKTLKENEELLADHNFIRPHKSHLINIRYIESFNRYEGGYIIMTDGSRIPVSRRKKEKIIDIINHL
ncbi:MAG: LytTR family DNA-binding domain-containing protein [Bacteroidales bacterium]|nr:LytTR family DNA-binding domain-containing protein [Bacteroidales bacterium]MCF8344308.1 LytTR family DNA-binding domain-containing protein [Bacteroidales bacterium]MCF8350907.1 LytTR family DNA-binding domain-containing protein [Bacteroidales bacterium]MCF8375781.1 LytTR family DNA-binding domain-containing protein [Bacteroidales bacterium]MCF8401537.1 LytTR family DNA-binding domain-containing protein [Bacteroidales bacterium]